MSYCRTWIKVAIFGILLQTVLSYDNIVKINYEVRRGSSVSDLEVGRKARIIKRDDSLNMEIQAEGTFYIATLNVGSNGDKNEVLVDTGSSDLWVMESNVICRYSSNMKREVDDSERLQSNRLQRKDLNECLTFGSFSPQKSTTFKNDTSAGAFYIEYLDNTYSLGYWGTDNVKIDNVEIKDVYFAVANFTATNSGVLGIGPKFMESSNVEYANLPYTLKNQGIIQKVAYSVYLNESDSNHGTILFGAVDLSKYTGPLMTLPVIEDDYFGNVEGLQILLSGLFFSDGKGNVQVMCNYTLDTLLDTGSTLSYLPSDTILKIASVLNGVYMGGSYRVDCNINSDSVLIFDFNGQQINVPISSFILEDGNGYCFLGIVESQSSYSLGDNFIRSVYMVVNLEDNEISLAQASYSDAKENIEIISDSVPNASKVPDYSYTEEYASITLTPSLSSLSFSRESTTTISGVESILKGSAVTTLLSESTSIHRSKTKIPSSTVQTTSKDTSQTTSKQTNGQTSGSSLTSAVSSSTTSRHSGEGCTVLPSKILATFLTLLAAMFIF